MNRYRWLLLSLFLFAAMVRLVRVDWDQYHFFHPDERRIAYAVQELSFRPLQLNPKFFAYGSFPFYVTKAVTSLLSNVNRWYSGYDGVIMTGRVLSALWGAFTVLLLALLGARLYGTGVGLLAGFFLAASVSHVQNSHFATNDIALTFLVLAALYFLVRVVQQGRPRHYLLAGFCIGLAAATKFSALPLLLPLSIAVLARMRVERRFWSPLLWGAAAVGMLAVAFAMGQPYALLDFKDYSHSILEQSNMVRHAGLFPYTNQYIGVPKYLYEMQEMVLWGMGPLLGIAAIWGTLVRCGRSVRTGNAAEIVLLSWVVPFFLVTGSFEVKFPRYLLPLYPLLCLWAAAWLYEWAQRSRTGRVARGAVIAGTLAALAAFMSIYTRPHATVTASEWVYNHIPAGSKILTQHWDEGFPMPLPGKQPQRYQIYDMPYYEPDTPAKIANMSRELASADYLAFQTKRLYGAITRAPQKFPLTNRYFYELFAGDLGYTMVKDVASRPSLFGLQFPDELADESFSVYDHPKAMIFKNVAHLSAAVIENKILNGAPSKPLTRNDLLLASAGHGDTLGGGGETELVHSSLLATFLCVLVLELLGLAVYALLRPALTPRLGLYAVSKVLGVLLLAYLSWIITSIGWLPFTRGSVLGCCALILALGLYAYRRHPDLELSRAEIISSEVLFWGAFFFFLIVRAYNPEIFWGEKPMDFSFLNTLYRTTALPPPEPWFAGSALNYTYFGHFLVATIGKGLSIHPAVMFNLGIAITAALTTAAVFGAGAALGRRWQVGAIAAFLATIAGNLAGVRELYARHVVNFDYFWATSRVIKDTINEFPLWTFLFADLHAHMMVMPFSMSFVCLLIMWVQRREKVSAYVPFLAAPVLLAFLALTLGALAVTSGWSTPVYATLLLFALGTYWLTTHEWEGVIHFFATAIGRILLPVAVVAGGAVLLFEPFWAHFTPPQRNWGWEHVQFARPWDYLNITGLFLFLIVPFFFVLWRRTLTPAGRRLRGLRLVAFVLAIAGLALTLVNVDALVHLHFEQAGSIRDFAFVLTVFGLYLTLSPATPYRYRYAVALATFAFAINAGCEVVYIWDRMNTIFKFYLEAWFLFALASAVILWELRNSRLGRGAWRQVWQVGFGALLLVSLFTTVTDTYGVITTRRVPTPRPTLDGMAYLQKHSPEELAAYQWLNHNVQGIPVLLEAYGPSYQEFARVTMNTGLPTVLGWDYHVFQRAHSWPQINRRKADIETIYTSKQESTVKALLDRYHVSLVFVGPLERRTYAGGNLVQFNQWKDLLKPVYQNPGVTIFAVAGRFAGTIPVTTIEEVHTEGLEAVPAQEPAGRLKQPRGVAADAHGNIYVCDFGNNRIQKFDAKLKELLDWGKRGELPGEFKDPCGVAVGPDNNVYVADTWNQRVQVFDSQGKYLREWGGGFYGPRGIAVAPSGEVYVSDTGNARVARFSADGKKLGEWGGKGSGPGKFTEPMGIATDAKGRVYVCDNGNGRLQIFDASGRFQKAFPVAGWHSEVFSEPYVVVDAQGTIWVTVPLAKEVRAYDLDGKLLKTIKTPPPPNNFVTPMGITIDPAGPELVISDLEHRLVRLPDALRH